MIEIRKHDRAGDFAPDLVVQLNHAWFGDLDAREEARQHMMTAFNEALANCHMWKQPACGPTWGLYVAYENDKPVGCYFLSPPPDSPVGTCCTLPILYFVEGDGEAHDALMAHVAATLRAAGYEGWESTHYPQIAGPFEAWLQRMVKAGKALPAATVVRFSLPPCEGCDQ